ncbi:MAG: hypothetical protein WA738_09700, partial [Candidatus Angelobacter sp.]
QTTADPMIVDPTIADPATVRQVIAAAPATGQKMTVQNMNGPPTLHRMIAKNTSLNTGLSPDPKRQIISGLIISARRRGPNVHARTIRGMSRDLNALTISGLSLYCCRANLFPNTSQRVLTLHP